MENNHKHQILLIEDDVFVRDLYVRQLKRGGYQVETAKDGRVGQQKALGQDYDLILLDIMLPKVNGIDVLKTLKDKRSGIDTPVFLLTNLGQETIIKEAFDIGAEGYFLKARLLPGEIVEHIDEFFATGKTPKELKKV